MARNIVIFSDGTGQVGGLVPDASHSNVYKLYRAARCDPDSLIDPEQQLTFYDPGLGSAADGEDIAIGWLRWIYNLLARATGLGITTNIIDCYAAIVRLCEPGDRIFLFGFSRGAYTARCVAGVLSLCGVPTRMKDGSPLKRDIRSAKAIAGEAVRSVYQHGAGIRLKSPRGQALRAQRTELAARFRATHASNGADGQANAVPYFIGVWDTVAALGVRLLYLLLLALAACAVVIGLGAALQALLHIDLSKITAALVTLMLLALGAWWAATHIKWATGLSVPWWKTLHVTGLKMRFYDKKLSARVKHAKHALSIDENRADFFHVPWVDSAGQERKVEKWFEQVWFAGVHSDVGGSYPENEARLSDIALAWMIEKAESARPPLLLDKRRLNLFPSPAGMQHDESKAAKIRWKRGIRAIPVDAPLHPTVNERYKLPAVLQYDLTLPYRPEALSSHNDIVAYEAGKAKKAEKAEKESRPRRAVKARKTAGKLPPAAS